MIRNQNGIERKIHYRMYKAKHGWIIAGVAVATFTLTTMTGQLHSTFAATDDPAANTQTAANTSQPDKVVTKTVTRTIHFVDAAGQTVSPDVVQTNTLSEDAQGTWHLLGTNNFVAVSAPTISGQTPDTQEVAAADGTTTGDVTVHYSAVPVAKDTPAADTTSTKDATAADTTTTTAPAQAAAVKTATAETAQATTPATDTQTGTDADATESTTGAQTDGTATSTATANTAAAQTDNTTAASSTTKDKQNATAAPKVEYKTLLDADGETQTISLRVDGSTTTTTTDDSYTGYVDVKPADGTPNVHTITVDATNIKKDDVITITAPDFKTISRTDTVNGLTNAVAADKSSISYTATNDNTNLSFSIEVSERAEQATGTDSGALTVALNGDPKQTVTMNVKNALRDVTNGEITDFSAGGSGSKQVSVGEDFATSIGVGYDDRIPLTDVNDYTFTIPVPDGYELDEEETEKMQLERNNSSIFDFSQAGVGQDVIAKLDIAKATAAGLNNIGSGVYGNGGAIPTNTYFVGKMTTGSSKVTATAAPTTTISTKQGNITHQAKTPMSVNVEKASETYWTSGGQKEVVYVSQQDVGQYNVNGSHALNVVKNTSADLDGEWTVHVPDGLSSKAITVSADVAQRDRGFDGTVSALDADGNVLATSSLSALNYDGNGSGIWSPSTNGTIKQYVVKITKMVNSSFGTVAIDPSLTVDAATAGTIKYPIVYDYAYATDNGVLKGTDDKNYGLTITTDHTIYQTYTSETATGSTVQGGDSISFEVHPFYNYFHSAYPILDEGAVIYVRLPDHTTFESTNKYNENTSVITEADGSQYLKIAVPAGDATNLSADGRYNKATVGYGTAGIVVNLKVNSDVVVGDDPTLAAGDSDKVLIGLPNNQMDVANWKSGAGDVKTVDAVAANNESAIAADAKALGIDQFYVGKDTTNTVWKVSVPTTLYLSNGVKADGEQSYAVDDQGIATFYPDAGTDTGNIRAYVYNGTTVPLSDYTTMVTLPTTADGAAYTLQLTGGATPAAGTTIKYSTQKYDVTKGTALTADQLSGFQDASAITDWSTVRSILVQSPSLEPATALTVQMPVKVADTGNTDTTANATAYSYADGADGKIFAAQINQLPTQIKTQRQVTVNYVDGDGNKIAPSQTLKGNIGDKITIPAQTIGGYTPKVKTQDFTYIDDNNQSVTFVYDKTTIQIGITYVNELTGETIKSENITGQLGDVIPLTDSKYTTIPGYTANSSNVKSYTVTNAQSQFINLYFAPATNTITVHYQFKDDSGKVTDLHEPTTTKPAYVGTSQPLTALTIPGYTVIGTATVNQTIGDQPGNYTFFYTRAQLPLTVKYVDETGTQIHPDGRGYVTVNAEAGTAAYDLNDLGLVASIDGYTLTAASVPLETGDAGFDKTTGKLTKDTVTLTYHKAVKQNATVLYVDDTEQHALATDLLTGNPGDVISYDVTAGIKKYTDKGYEVVSNDYDPTETYDDDEATDQNFTIHLKHGTTTTKKTITVTRTINYVVSDGNATAPDALIQKVEFTQTAVTDNVTSTTKTTNMPTGGSFAAVGTPHLSGYVADTASVAAATVAPTDANSTVTVTYTPVGAQNAQVVYVDDKTNTQLATEDLTGAYNTDITYNSADGIKVYTDKGYELVSNGFDTPSKYDDDDTTTQKVYIHLTHGTVTKTVTTPITRTINYVVSDGNAAAPQAVVQTATFTQLQTLDAVTKAVLSTADATPTSVPLDAVNSDHIDGYNVDKSTVAATDVHFGDKSSTVTVTYTPVGAQKANVVYIDDTTKQTLATEEVTGAYNTNIAYDSATGIKNYADKGYELVSNGFDTPTKYDDDDTTNQTVYIHLIHGTSFKTVTTPITRTINYVVSDGNAPAPQAVVQTATFTQTATVDNVTGKTLSKTVATPASVTLDAVTSDHLDGYNVDKSTVTATDIHFGDKSSTVTVTYTPVGAQKANVVYIDDTTKQTLATEEVTGAYNTNITYDAATGIKEYADKGYELVSNGFDTPTKYDDDDTTTQTVYIHLIHGTSFKTVTTPITRTINYVVSDGNAPAPQAVVQTATFTQTATVDNVTGKTLSKTVATPASVTLDAVTSEHLDGYNVDKSTVTATAVHFGDKNSTVTVTYTPVGAQKANVVYIDDTTKQTLATEKVTGAYNTDITYDSATGIKNYTDKGYELVSNGFDTPTKYDDDDTTTQTITIHLIHGTTQNTVTTQVTRTINYVVKSGDLAAPEAVTQTARFSQTTVKDAVTGATISVTKPTPSSADFAAVPSEQFDGYMVDKPNVAAKTVQFGDANTTETVTYWQVGIPETNPQVKTEVPEAPSTTPDKYYDNTDGDAQHAAMVYFDDTTHQWLHTDNLRGNTGTVIDYDAAAGIKNYTDKGYELVSNGFQSGTTYDADDATTQTFTIHLQHGTSTQQLKTSVTRTINYVVADGGTQAPAPVVQQVDFTRTVTVDKVTGQVISSTPATPTSGDFAEVYTPNLKGYAADTIVVPATTVHYGSTNATVTVTYRPVALGPGKQVWTKVEMPEPVSTTPAPDNGGTITPGGDDGTPTDTTPEGELPDTDGGTDTPTNTPETNGADGTDIGQLPDTFGGETGSGDKQNATNEQQNLPATSGSTAKNAAGKAEQQLPQTGDAKNSGLSALGLAIAGFFALLGFGKKRRNGED
ncbi:mucin-binding protein [Lacticaseibacillus zhaodongensis]|uniref:mucin-binding protein n=1 Tax=Lacticaseibacillus zhaodongensis TaxID=2668065 RepID=UPI0012D32DCD|nr:MucBP domain-containing protein [Lacticaseibacillus zhaodongensis]